MARVTGVAGGIGRRYSFLSPKLTPISPSVSVVLGWVLQRFEYPVAATVVGLRLARSTEGSIPGDHQMSGGDPAFIVQRPITLFLLDLSFCRTLLGGWLRRMAQHSRSI